MNVGLLFFVLGVFVGVGVVSILKSFLVSLGFNFSKGFWFGLWFWVVDVVDVLYWSNEASRLGYGEDWILHKVEDSRRDRWDNHPCKLEGELG